VADLVFFGAGATHPSADSWWPCFGVPQQKFTPEIVTG